MTEYRFVRFGPGPIASAIARLCAVLSCALLLSACEAPESEEQAEANAGALNAAPGIAPNGSGTTWSVSSP